MKKIIKVFLLLLAVGFNSLVVNAGNIFYSGLKSEGVYLKVTRPDGTVYRSVGQITSTLDNGVYYCLEMRNPMIQYHEYFEESNEPYNVVGYSKEKWERIANIAYYGYGYGNHTESYWYGVTQVMIWNETNPSDWKIEFTNTSVGAVVPDKFKAEMDEINNLIENNKKVPNISNDNYSYNININEQKVIEDTNNSLANYKFIRNDINAYIDNNKIYFSSNVPGDYTITLTNNDNNGYLPKIYYYESYQKIINAPSPISNTININVHVKGGRVELYKNDSENINRIDANLNQAVYAIYDTNDNYVSSITTNSDGYGISDFMNPGRYYFKEIKASTGYELDQEKHYFEVNDNNVTTVNLQEQVIKRNIKFIKYKTIDGKNIKEKDISFKVTRISNNKEIIVTTNKKGETTFELDYGKYQVTQLNSSFGFQKIDDFIIDVNEEFPTTYSYKLYDKQIKKQVSIIKKDSDTKLTLTEGFKFKIFSYFTNSFINIDNKTTFVTDKEGKFSLNLPYGDYYLEEIASNDLYELNPNKYYFRIDQDTPIDYEIIFYNQLKSKKIEKETELIKEPIVEPIKNTIEKTITYHIPNTLSNSNKTFYIIIILGIIYVLKKIK
ncbi:MAG: Cys-Gln thioester bond-forming surface protein [Bacilli bacterium]|nr:Cys-Gln thioester bond-forming surface protein [Bacilli bacterium]